MSQLGPIGKLGHWTATHFRAVLVAWLVIAVVFGVFAPRVETALSGAGWEATGSESVQARDLVAKNFKGLGSYGLMVVVHSPTQTTGDPAFRQAVAGVERTLRADRAVTHRRAAAAGRLGLARRPHRRRPGRRRAQPERDGPGGGRAEGPAGRARRPRRAGQPDRRAGDVVGLQRGQQVGDAEVRGHLLAGHARHPRARVRLAGRRRAAADADDPRARRRRRLAVPRHPAAGHLDLGDELRADVRARAGHRLRAVRRLPLPRRLLRLGALGRGGDRGDDGHRRQGRPVQRPDGADLAQRRDARAQPGVPVDEPRDHARGHLRAGRDADAAARRAGQARAARGQAGAQVGALRRAPLGALRGVGRATVAAPAALRARLRRGPRRARAAGLLAGHRHAVDQGRPDRGRLAPGL